MASALLCALSYHVLLGGDRIVVSGYSVYLFWGIDDSVDSLRSTPCQRPLM